ncbi:MAG: hypothetical protein J6J37_00980 [Bacteroidaceae bacterium]|nr:hypothetical protein [Bacteroidaceae bacterium]
MKKIYIAPQIYSIELDTTSIIASSSESDEIVIGPGSGPYDSKRVINDWDMIWK